MSVPNHYIIDFSLLAKNLQLTELREDVLVALLDAVAEEFQEIHNTFLAYRESNIYKIEHTSQVWSLEKVLNDAYDPELRRIYITDGELVEPPYIFRRAEERPLYLFKRSEDSPIYLRRRSENADSDRDFIVHLPADAQEGNATDELAFIASISATVDYYKEASKTYRIVYE